MTDALAEIIGVMLWIACVIVALALLPACSPKLADISIAPPPAEPCPIPKLPPVPKDALLDISGTKITANAGGEVLLRGYVQCRSSAALAR